MLDWSNPARKYAEMTRDLIGLMGVKDGSIPVITRQDHPQQWRDWYAYYGFRRLLGSQEIMRSKDQKTVPTLSPFDFDAEFNLPYEAPPVPRFEEDNWHPQTAGDRQRVKQIYEAFQRGNNINFRQAAE